MEFEHKCMSCGERTDRDYGPGDGRDARGCPECGSAMSTVRA